jgi:8-oxo-dGTP diphosphatase
LRYTGSMSDKFSYVGSAYLMLIKDGKILLLRRANTDFEDGNYGLPAGHMDGNETAREGCVREVREEIGILVEPKDLTLAHLSHRKAARDERFDLFWMTSSYTGEIRNVEPNKCDDLSWFPLDALPPNTIEYIRLAIEHVQKGVLYSEYGWE